MRQRETRWIDEQKLRTHDGIAGLWLSCNINCSSRIGEAPLQGNFTTSCPEGPEPGLDPSYSPKDTQFPVPRST